MTLITNKNKLFEDEDLNVDYIGDIGKDNNCEDFKYINYEHYTKDDFKQMLFDKINNSEISSTSLLIVNHIMDLLNKLENK